METTPEWDRRLWLGPVTCAWFFAWTAGLDALRPEYDFAHKAVSELGALGAPYMASMNLFGFLGTGALLAGFAAGYRATFGAAAVGVRALYSTALLFAATAIPMGLGADGDPDYTSAWTRAHLVPVLLAPLPWLAAVWGVARQWRGGSLRSLGWISGLALVLFVAHGAATISGVGAAVPGAMQRVGFAVFLGWYAAFGVAAMTLAARTSSGTHTSSDPRPVQGKAPRPERPGG